MDVSFRQVRAIEDGVWAGPLTAAEAARLPGAPLKIAGPHVLLLERPAWNGADLKAPFTGVSVLALGHGEVAIFLSTDAGAPTHTAAAPPQAVAPDGGQDPAATPLPHRRRRNTGDDEMFVYGLNEMGADMARIGRALLARIRATYDGALSHTGYPRKFVETPDNFWGVEIQPRRRAIKLTVRSSEERLKDSGLPYESERPPSYYAMRICEDRDIETALKLLTFAIRQPVTGG